MLELRYLIQVVVFEELDDEIRLSRVYRESVYFPCKGQGPREMAVSLLSYSM